jgi:hypothetical protein
MADLEIIDTHVEDVDGLEDKLLNMDAVVEQLKSCSGRGQLDAVGSI